MNLFKFFYIRFLNITYKIIYNLMLILLENKKNIKFFKYFNNLKNYIYELYHEIYFDYYVT